MCILQTSGEDKAWQVRRMFSLYQHCKVSLVLPGGIQRLAAHDEGTNWIERAWTLQEAGPGMRGMREMAVWRSALVRTCSVACDMVFSVMGVLGVELKVERYGPGIGRGRRRIGCLRL